MSHAYPLARNVTEALDPAARGARTRTEAEKLAGGLVVESLHTEWLSVSEEEAAAKMAGTADALTHGFLQRYEDDKGAPVLAVSYWRLVDPAKAKKAAKPKKPAPVAEPKADEADHTDDLYFRSGRTKPGRRKRFVDPNQLDLFEPNEG
ncbi:hypothetical protein [Hyphomonas chukchiensis]|uniref:Uncharacterized protein n=1 Tax=Hyphomonas chukchiensis TaxID=1280947 RepID=A0A062U820_9PROT|nr:hypothetical protein [Hyphomonas chukchiensis]KCZ56496.1 hypothetical protein HY30_18365 [Hyphomonas chukchiensis]